jgi:N-acyl-D-amino-acid deacylase
VSRPVRGPRTVLRGGTVVDGSGGVPRPADVALRGAVVEGVGVLPTEPGDTELDATGRYLLPGFIDAHSHADAAVFLPDVQLGLLRQGVTSVIAGQDGVSFAPGDGGYASSYFGSINGAHPTYRGGGVGELLSTYDGTTPVNVGYVVPAGTVRHEVRGFTPGPSSPEQLAAMSELVRAGLAEGALGLSTGLDYVPNIYADLAELVVLCRPVAGAGGLYVTHMRGGYESNAPLGIEEVAEIALRTGVSVHVSHYHGPAQLLVELVDGAAVRGVDLTFDSYPYRRGCSILAMPVLPPSLLDGGNADVAARLLDPAVRHGLLESWFPTLQANPDMGPEWPDNLTFAHIAAEEYAWAHGLTVRAAAARAGVAPEPFSLDVLAASLLEVNVVMKVRDQRPYDDLAKLVVHPSHVAGSDGIFVGRNPHPRGWGTFAKFLRVFTRERGDLSWPAAAVHLSSRTARRYGLSDRGMLRPGYAADLVVVDPEVVGDRADYGQPRVDSVGIDEVFVGGEQVLAGGQLTGATPGRGLRRTAPVR